MEKVVAHILNSWVKRDGSFRSRKLHLGWDNVPMHRWGQSQMFRSLAFYLSEAKKGEKLRREMPKENGVEKSEVLTTSSLPISYS
ncbi:MAG: hypothetical protein DME85_09140 [Verrucomicrobia bacterium]|nr:MAG: hypothetical protein DME85_09140 [Verrucomicrobiota bacterium]